MRTRLQIGLALTVALLALPATPALAQFAGSVTQAVGGASVLTIPGGQVSCSGAKAPEPSNTTTKVNLGAVIWSGCALKTGKEAETASLGCNEFTFEQLSKVKGSGLATMKFGAECNIAALSGCSISLPTAGNQKLSTVKLTNGEGEVRASLSIANITANVNAACKTMGITSTETGTFQLIELQLSGISLA
jgi:hypothetical protein